MKAKLFLLGLYRSSIYIIFILTFLSSKINPQSLKTEQIFRDASRSVVVIYAYDFYDNLSALGSGVVINNKGLIATNYHILQGNHRIEISHYDKRISNVEIVGMDKDKDILILRINNDKFPAIKIGETKSLTVGQRIYAIGNPKGLENTISEGIISGFRNLDNTGNDLIQITASISPGSSGGAVVNTEGKLIGISTLSIVDGQNLNFAIPITEVLKVSISSDLKNDESYDSELLSLGKQYGKEGNYSKAMECYNLFIQNHPNIALGYFLRASLKFDMADFEGAIQDYTNSIAIDPDNSGSYINRANCWKFLGKNYMALDDYTDAIKIDPNIAAYYYNRGSIKFDLSDFRGAIQDYSDAIELDSKFTNAYFNRGAAKSHLGDKYGACLDFSKAGELGHPDAYKIIMEYCN